MTNNFNFNASIKLKELDKMENIIKFLTSEGIQNKDLIICQEFKNLLSSFDDGKFKLWEVVNSFNCFYDTVLVPYCKGNFNVKCDSLDVFDFEEVQYVMNKMKEIINVIGASYNVK